MTMPNFAEAVFSRSLEQAVLWKVSPVRGLSINCHFFTRDEIEFDIAPWEIHGQPELDALAAFITTIGRATTKGVLLCHENAPDCPVGTYSPDSRLFVRTSSDDRASTG